MSDPNKYLSGDYDGFARECEPDNDDGEEGRGAEGYGGEFD